MDIYLINVNDDEITDDSVVDILNSIGGGSNKIVLFEDIDTAFADKKKLVNEHKLDIKFKTKSSDNTEEETRDTEFFDQSKKFLTYSGLLNALDGMLSNQNGVFTIMTTNHIDRLGAAFLRPGRIDRKFELKECNDEQIVNMVKTFIQKRNKIFKSCADSCVDLDDDDH